MGATGSPSGLTRPDRKDSIFVFSVKLLKPTPYQRPQQPETQPHSGDIAILGGQNRQKSTFLRI